MTYFIAPISIGLGDLIVSLPAVQALIDTGQDTYLITRSAAQEELAPRIKGLRGSVTEELFSLNDLSSNDKYINMREHPLQTDFWWGSTTCDRFYPGYKINDFLKIICGDLGIDANFEDLKPLQFSPKKNFKDSVAFIPGTDSMYKCWPKEKWLSLASLFKSKDIPIVLIGKPEASTAVQELLPHLDHVPTPALENAVDVLSSVKAVIAVDTGLMHLSVQQGIPTIAIYRSHPVYERNYAHSFSLSARPCDARCITKSKDYTYNEITDLSKFEYRSWQCQAETNQFCMDHISSESVFAIAETESELFLNTNNKPSAGH